ncbi:MAG: carbohydrate porin [Rhodanobacter sp.]|nr:MAG: carbohydrate porin [Rhodanobacter sp.]TAM38179.1 MAG: carbohydrate porin [Rhodanobacter sp.]TAN26399.1 MAG: carbohydrate porin [Rhodanobacter sp.]
MHKSIRCTLGACVVAALSVPSMAAAMDAGQSSASSQENSATNIRMNAMQQQIDALQKQLDAMRAAQAASNLAANKTPLSSAPVTARDAAKTSVAKVKPKQQAEKSDEGIHIGGAMRFQYSYEDYNRGNVQRKGDADFDIFRLNMRGKVDDIELQAEWRWFQYMSAIKFAWLGYDFSKTSQLQVGITRIPFGNQPYDSHSYFFSSNYYLGLEDTYHAGAEYVYAGDPWNVQLAFFKNDAMGGVDGYVSNRSNSYSYNVVGVRQPGDGIFDNPSHPIGSANTSAARVAYTFKPGDVKLELGASALYGSLESPAASVGNYHAYALHMNADYKRWNVQAQASRYHYQVDGGADRLAVGAYAFYDSIPARADTYTFNVKYHQPVQWGPIHSLDFYNDYSLVTHKSGLLPSTFMNDLGVGVSAGDLYTYFDFLTARNQPFVGGSMAGDGAVEHRVNVNFGFYF